MNFFEGLGELIERYLDSNKSWTRSHIKSIREIEERNPWRETNWRHDSGWYFSHWENVVTPSHMSMHSPRHVWKIACSKSTESWGLGFNYGVAPYKGQKL